MEKLAEICFTDKAMEKTVKRAKSLYTERKNNAVDESAEIKKELKSLEGTIDNWIDAIGEGALDLNTHASKIKQAEEKKSF